MGARYDRTWYDGEFTLPDTETDIDTNRKMDVHCVHSTQRQMPTQIPIGFCIYFISLSLCLGIGHCHC